MDKDTDTITCTVNWATTAYTEKVYTENIIITIRDGPAYDYQDAGWTGDPIRPIYLTRQFKLFDDTVDPPQQLLANVSLRSVFPGNTSSSNLRVIGCTVIGVHASSTLPVYVQAMSKIVLGSNRTDEPWKDFIYPRYTEPCLGTGCISTVSRGLHGPVRPISVLQPGYVTMGAAFDWSDARNRTDTVFVRFDDDDPQILRISPLTGDAVNLIDLVDIASLNVDFYFKISSTRGFVAETNGDVYFNSRNTLSVAFCRSGNYSQCMGTEYRLGAGRTSCPPVGVLVQSSSIAFKALGNPWSSPNGNGLYIVDGTCGLLYQIDQNSFKPPNVSPNCDPLGTCGLTTVLANLTEKANFLPDGRPTSIVGDVARDILYIAYANQCGIMSLKLSTAEVIGWVTGTNVTVNSTTISTPLCGFSGDGSPGRCKTF